MLSGEIDRQPRRIGLPMLRLGKPTPCGECPKIPADAPEKSSRHAIELSVRNVACVTHWLESRAVGGFAEHEKRDPWFRRHARILQAVWDEREREPMERVSAMLLATRFRRG